VTGSDKHSNGICEKFCSTGRRTKKNVTQNYSADLVETMKFNDRIVFLIQTLRQ